MKNRVITRKRGVIPGCRAPEPDSHMAVDGLGRLEVAKLPSTVDACLAALAKKSGSRGARAGAPPQTGEPIEVATLRSDRPQSSGGPKRGGRRPRKPAKWPLADAALPR
jgi:hypothetical protein